MVMRRVCLDAISTENSIVKHVLEGEVWGDFCLRTEDYSLLMEDMTGCRMGKRKWEIILWQRSDKVSGVGMCVY